MLDLGVDVTAITVARPSLYHDLPNCRTFLHYCRYFYLFIVKFIRNNKGRSVTLTGSITVEAAPQPDTNTVVSDRADHDGYRLE